MSDHNTSQKSTLRSEALFRSANMTRLLRYALQLLAVLAVCLLAGCSILTFD